MYQKAPYFYGTGRRKSSVARVKLIPGGTGVITPETGGDSTIRIRRIIPVDLNPGDMILCSGDALFRQTAVLFCTEDGLICQDSGNVTLLREEDARRHIEGLPGQFCYIVLRPSAAERK